MKDVRRYRFEFMERNRDKIRSGDVFVIKIHKRDLYFYGKVIDEIREDKAEIRLIFLYKTPTAEIVVPENLDVNDVMAVLEVPGNTWVSGWEDGVFKNICNIPVTEEERNFDYGFYDCDKGTVITEDEVEKYSEDHEIIYGEDGNITAATYVDFHRNVLDHTPKITSECMISFYKSVSRVITNYLRENPDLKKKFGLDKPIEGDEDREFDLEFLEKSRKWIRNGDVFVMKIRGCDLYFYGKVIDIKASMGGFAKPYLIYLYKTPTTEIVIPDDMDENDVLTAVLAKRDGWSDGFFKTVCNIPVKDEEINLDYGFEYPDHSGFMTEEEIEEYSKDHGIYRCKDGSIITHAYYDAFDNVRDHVPKIIHRHCFSFWTGVAYDVFMYLNHNPDIRHKYGLE